MAQQQTSYSGSVSDRTLYYSDLGFMDPALKNQLWFSQSLFYAKLNSIKFLETKKKILYRNLEKGIINEQEYKEIIDPKLPQGGGGTAEYFVSDFKDCPIFQHLDNGLRARMEKIGKINKLQVDTIDKFAISQKQRDKSAILYQCEIRKVMNNVLKTIGLPEMKNGQSPKEYISLLKGEKADKVIGGIDTLIDYIKTQIQDKHDLALYQSYVYKGNIELAIELGIQYFLIDQNKWVVEKSDWFNNDVKNFNKACGRLYTDDTTGRPIVAYMEPDELFTSPFKRKNGEDILYWFHEYEVTFADFVREVGTQLTEDQLKEAFELNKQFGGGHGMNYDKAGGFKGSNAKIKIGIFSVLTQDAENFHVGEISTANTASPPLPAYRKLDWRPDKKRPTDYEASPRTKMYNVWYSGYYLVPPEQRLTSNSITDWAWQAQYVWRLKKDIDMYRYGVDARYAKSTLVVWKDESRMSYTDIKEAFAPKIRTSWHRFQNALVNDISGTWIAHDLMIGIINATDEANKKTVGSPDKPVGGNGYDAGITAWRQFRQAGMGWHSFRDTKGNMILEPQKLFIEYDNKQLDKAERYLKVIMDQYNLLTIALAQNNVSQGQNPKTHTTMDAVKASLAASLEGEWFIEKAVREILVMYGERIVQYILYMVKEKKTYGLKERFEEFSSVVGLANSMLLESVENMWPEEIGLTVDLEDVAAMKEYYIGLTNQMLKDGKVDIADIEMIVSSIQQNYKYGAVLLTFAARRQQQELANKEELDFKRSQELKKMDLQIAQALQKAKADGKDQNLITGGKVQEMVDEAMNKHKAETMANQKQQLLNNKLEQQSQKSQLDRQEKTADALAPETT